ncbi:ARM repeat-containing protein [Epithele typhae]|uniref:ARM repeat-containing protein n=1 Tax=Epithele typhae TaxID=378194 RepID=UPI0020075326|nr:ARM repeat-containing protein [Epithele typhae]KAH9943383.1 ARM repeat-containing protein [Epithele typhae]
MSHKLSSQAQPQQVSPEELYNVVCGAASQNPAQVQASTTIPGAYDILHEIAAQRTVPLQVRQQAIIQFKNAATGHWRSRKLFPPESKQRIRDRCLTFLDEQDDIVAQCNALIVAKIARQDYPVAWPTLLSHLGNAISTSLEGRASNTVPNATIVLRRCLQLLNAILKEYAAFKMLTGVKTMGKMIEDIWAPMQAHYARLAVALPTISPVTLNQPSVAEDILLAHLVFKCLVKMAFWAYHRFTCSNDYHEFEPWVQEFFQSSAVQLQRLSEMRISLRVLDLLTRHVRVFGKLFRRMQRDRPTYFVTLPTAGNLVLYYWSKVVQATSGPSEQIADSSLVVFPVRFIVQGMALFKDSLAQWAPTRKDGSPNEKVLSKDFVEDAVKILVTRFIPLNPSDLDNWMADPEEWVNTEEKENDQWEFELRPCGERVLMTLATQYPQFVRPLIETTFHNLVNQRSAELSVVIQKEALYCAVGRCAIRLKDAIPFQQWLENSLVSEAQETNQNYPIVKRRIAWLLGKLVSDECLVANNEKLWQVLVHLLQDQGPGTDAVVRLTAAIAIRECVDSLNFDADSFAPFLQPVVASLVRLTAEADTLEAKRRITDSLNTVIERAEARIVPLMDMVAQPIPQLWASAEEDWLFKACLLGTITKLVEATKVHSSRLTMLIVPLVRESLAPPAALQLDEDAFALWLSALRNVSSIQSTDGGPGLIDLVPLILEHLAKNLDLLGTVVQVFESYIFLGATQILQLAAVDLFRACNATLNMATSSANAKQVTVALCSLLQLAPSGMWGEAIHVSGLFTTIVKGFEEEKLETTILTEYVFILARIAVADRQLFLQLVSAMAASESVTESVVWEPILNQWWQRFDNMSEPRHRKLTAMGIANLVATATEICNLWIDVFGEIKEAEDSRKADDGLTLYWDRPFEEGYTESEGTLEYERRKTLFENDVVRTTPLTAYIGARLQEAEAACGGAAELQARYLAKAEPLLLKQITDALMGNLP